MLKSEVNTCESSSAKQSTFARILRKKFGMSWDSSDMDEIETGLWLGAASAARNSRLVKEKGITHILTVEFCVLSEEHRKDVKYLFIHAGDDEQEDLLSHFPQAIRFMEAAQAEGGAVLVHCFVGVSRSATLVTAFLMHKYGIHMDEALKRIHARRFVSPNSGFLSQLSVFGAMGCQIDMNDPDFRRYRLMRFAHSIKYRHLQKQTPEGLLALDPDPDVPGPDDSGPDDTSPDVSGPDVQGAAGTSAGGAKGTPGSGPGEAVYRCRKCRRALFLDRSLLPHAKGGGEAFFDWRKALAKKQEQQRRQAREQQESKRCRESLRVEPVEWMRPQVLGELEGKLQCPRCEAKLGTFNWAGDRCACGTIVVPSFHMHRDKVDLHRAQDQVASALELLKM